ncbi:hypothetical protein CPB83DRAFT_857702 [Crepidotus variabilis]|uniref:Uncharacterized protein n=1 Tax=Crepidotus variabilis TaxID=179855 RepID=A0A9P6EBT3_9AGAR|nr:hypothetical protein CPB83DRAFT_857702 [Crepidotus variabilis]
MCWKTNFTSTIFSACFALPLIVSAPGDSQAPLRSISSDWIAGKTSQDNWDLALGPDVNSTSQWIFDTVNSLLKLWPNTRLRNGHNIVPGILPVGTLLYHGTSSRQVPTTSDWTAIDPEHSYLFCRDMTGGGKGCWHLTLAVTHPLKVCISMGAVRPKCGEVLWTAKIFSLGEAFNPIKHMTNETESLIRALGRRVVISID